ncbi:hypothetical protein HHL16_07340 [Pseudoflavitalea sp. G-6-1-2]|uniref:PepSY-like domain-containing protein n=1 Tax=Pseudoflavitalea sp. G-6-1-2 TaxID=2728841 RepID=UPI00146F08BA|nr:PepSY-like domain-containing protein [Pseudoflavitalea sp. G-6-1-2]NML20682.1 hypothetical protein [Pseudoflavitalea sp. G-6-1-2]
MKKSIALFLTAALLIVAQNTLFAQLRKVPAAVTEAFKKKYPKAENVEWKDKVTVFVAEFQEGKTEYEARFTNKGEWKSTENEIGVNDIPSTVKDGLRKSKYAEWEVESAHKIILPEDKIQYRVRIKKSDLQVKNLSFNEDGQLLKDNITL